MNALAPMEERDERPQRRTVARLVHPLKASSAMVVRHGAFLSVTDTRDAHPWKALPKVRRDMRSQSVTVES